MAAWQEPPNRGSRVPCAILLSLNCSHGEACVSFQCSIFTIAPHKAGAVGSETMKLNSWPGVVAHALWVQRKVHF